MAKIKVKVKQGSKGKPLGTRIAEFRAKEGEKGKELYRPKAKMTLHLEKWRQQD
jgi:hypothetical protein